MTFSDWMSFFQTLLVILGGYVAWRGIDSWRHEMIGRRKSEIGEETLALFYEAQTLIERARFPGSMGAEGRSRPLTDGETEDDRQRHLDALYVPVERMQTDSVGSSRVDLQACKLEYSIVSPK